MEKQFLIKVIIFGVVLGVERKFGNAFRLDERIVFNDASIGFGKRMIFEIWFVFPLLTWQIILRIFEVCMDNEKLWYFGFIQNFNLNPLYRFYSYTTSELRTSWYTL